MLSTLLLLDLEYDLNNNDVDEDEHHPPCCLILGIGMDHPLQDSARGGVGSIVIIEETPVHIHLFYFMSGTRK